jgi:hypothetical protein
LLAFACLLFVLSFFLHGIARRKTMIMRMIDSDNRCIITNTHTQASKQASNQARGWKPQQLKKKTKEAKKDITHTHKNEHKIHSTPPQVTQKFWFFFLWSF